MGYEKCRHFANPVLEILGVPVFKSGKYSFLPRIQKTGYKNLKLKKKMFLPSIDQIDPSGSVTCRSAEV